MKQTYKQTDLSAVAAQTDTFTAWIDCGSSTYGSYHIVWTSLTTGSAIAGVAQVQTSNDPKVLTAGASPQVITKTGAVLNVTTATGSDAINLNNVLSERFVRLKWSSGGTVTGGTLTVFTNLKG